MTSYELGFIYKCAEYGIDCNDALEIVKLAGNITFKDPNTGKTYTAPMSQIRAAGGPMAYAAAQNGAAPGPQKPRLRAADFGGGGVTPAMNASMASKTPGAASATMRYNSAASRGAPRSIGSFSGGSRATPAPAPRQPNRVASSIPPAGQSRPSFNTIESRGANSSIRGFSRGRPGRRMGM